MLKTYFSSTAEQGKITKDQHYFLQWLSLLSGVNEVILRIRPMANILTVTNQNSCETVLQFWWFLQRLLLLSLYSLWWWIYEHVDIRITREIYTTNSKTYICLPKITLCCIHFP